MVHLKCTNFKEEKTSRIRFTDPQNPAMGAVQLNSILQFHPLIWSATHGRRPSPSSGCLSSNTCKSLSSQKRNYYVIQREISQVTGLFLGSLLPLLFLLDVCNCTISLICSSLQTAVSLCCKKNIYKNLWFRFNCILSFKFSLKNLDRVSQTFFHLKKQLLSVLCFSKEVVMSEEFHI